MKIDYVKRTLKIRQRSVERILAPTIVMFHSVGIAIVNKDFFKEIPEYPG